LAPQTDDRRVDW
jgi:hypothetical protein